ncbi:unnamed protein product, partial [Mesorhabditis spiculigera]
MPGRYQTSSRRFWTGGADWPMGDCDLAAKLGATTIVDQDSEAALEIRTLFQQYAAQDYGPEIDTMYFRCPPPNDDVVMMTRRHLRRPWLGLGRHAGRNVVDHLTMSITIVPSEISF